MRDKAFIFDEMRKVRRTLGVHDSAPWLEMALGLALLALAAAVSMVR